MPRLALSVSLFSLFSLFFRPTVLLASDGERSASPRGDYLLPEPGRLSASVGSGVPFLGAGELAYGFGSDFAVGVLVAATPDMSNLRGTAAVGVRPRGVVFRKGAWRSMIIAAVLYYPGIPGFGSSDSWVLARTEITLERQLDSGASLAVGLGVIGAACTESLVTLGRERDADVMGGVWDTVRVGGSLPVGGRAIAFGEASLVLDGVVPAHRWIGITPVIAVAGVAWSL